MSKTILIVDDSRDLRTMVKAYMEQEGYCVLTAANGKLALEITHTVQPDLILLDLMMPEMDGYEFIRQFAREHDTPIIVLTAKPDENDKILGLELGADDYVTKPFSPRELTARVRAVLRRFAKANADSELIQLDGLTLNHQTRQVMVNDQLVNLTPSEFDLLAVLMREPGRVFSRMDLLERIQGHAYEGYERTIDVHIRNLRTKIEPEPGSPTYVETVYGVGYRLGVSR
ncbi:MAG: response regulator transcription factor [Chloroflexota bacterium]